MRDSSGITVTLVASPFTVNWIVFICTALVSFCPNLLRRVFEFNINTPVIMISEGDAGTGNGGSPGCPFS
jgi:hypothetical protein